MFKRYCLTLACMRAADSPTIGTCVLPPPHQPRLLLLFCCKTPLNSISFFCLPPLALLF